MDGHSRMSTASPETSSDQPQRTSQNPGPLALLAATAIGGVLATRMGKTPFLLAAGAAAVALLRQKSPEPQNPALPPSAPDLDLPAQALVEQWLSQQIIREEQAPVVELIPEEFTPTEPEDDYHPESFLLDETDEIFRAPADTHSFAALSAPVPEQIPELGMERTQEQEQEDPLTSPPPQVFAPPFVPLPAADAAWTLGVEPLPSVNESGPYVAPDRGMFFRTPSRPETSSGTAPEPPVHSMFSSAPAPFFPSSVFEGAALPDEISVVHPSEPTVPASESAELPASEPAPWTEMTVLAKSDTTAEIPVELANPGDASFDAPLAAVLHDPWQPGPEDLSPPPPSFPAFPVKTPTTRPVVEAEIFLRPRAPTKNSVTAKSKPPPTAFSKHFPAEMDTSPAESASEVHFPGPLQSPREPTARATTWRSWWRGD